MTILIWPKFYFSSLYDSHVFSFEFNKGLECSKSPYGNNLSSFNLSNKRIIYLLSLLIVFIFFLCHVIFAHNVLKGIFAMTWSLPYLLPRLPFRVFNLEGSSCLNFFLGSPFGFST